MKFCNPGESPGLSIPHERIGVQAAIRSILQQTKFPAEAITEISQPQPQIPTPDMFHVRIVLSALAGDVSIFFTLVKTTHHTNDPFFWDALSPDPIVAADQISAVQHFDYAVQYIFTRRSTVQCNVVPLQRSGLFFDYYSTFPIMENGFHTVTYCLEKTPAVQLQLLLNRLTLHSPVQRKPSPESLLRLCVLYFH